MSQYTYQPALPLRETNGLGVAGFILSLLGLFTAGTLSLIGVILSLVALGRQPRGFAIAGIVIGLLGLCGWFVAIVLLGVGAAILAVLGISMLADAEKFEISKDMLTMAVAVKRYEKESRYLPADLSVLDLPLAVRTDPWGQAYRYHFDDSLPAKFDIVSTGEDTRLGTPDDVRFSKLGETWKAGGLGMHVEESKDGGRVTITLGDRSLVAEGDDEGGIVVIDLGDRVLEIVGDEAGGRVRVGGDDASGAPGAPETPDAPGAPDAPDSSPPREGGG
jgi:hypothetical protein